MEQPTEPRPDADMPAPLAIGVGWSPPTDATASRSWRQRHWRELFMSCLAISVVAALIAAIRFGPNTEAKISPVATVVGHTVAVTGTTDLPDGVQLDGYLIDEAMFGSVDPVNDESPAGTADCEATVRQGVFSCVADITGWTPGSGSGSVGFAVADGQPQALFDRYGADGAGLLGPDVHHPDDSNPYYSQDVGFAFTIP